jgi:hypothetical protein
MPLTSFRDLLATRFSLEELQSLCLDLGIPYEEIPGATLTAKVEGLIGYARRRRLLPQLWARVRELRPDAPWLELDDLLEAARTAPPPAPDAGGGSYHVHIGGAVGQGAQLAVGQHITQVQARDAGPAAELLAELRAAIQAELTPDMAAAAGREVAALQDELAAAEPSLTRLEQLREYFATLGGRVAAAAKAVFQSEPAQAALKTAAEIAVTAALKRFGG